MLQYSVEQHTVVCTPSTTLLCTSTLRDVLRVLYCTGENWSTTYYSTMYSTGAVARRRESAVRVISRESRESFCGNGQLHMTATVYPSSQYAVPGTWYWSVCYAYCIDSTSTTS